MSRPASKYLTEGAGMTTVFDRVGKDTFEGSLKSVKRLATGIAIGYARNHMGPDLVGDPRATNLCHAVFDEGP